MEHDAGPCCCGCFGPRPGTVHVPEDDVDDIEDVDDIDVVDAYMDTFRT